MSDDYAECYFCKTGIGAETGAEQIEMKPHLYPADPEKDQGKERLSCSSCWIEVIEGSVVSLRDQINAGIQRERLPDERAGVTHKFTISNPEGEHEGYITVGEYPDGRLGEVFVKMAKQGSAMSGLMDVVSTQMSIMLQYGVPLKVLVRKFSYALFDPSGITKHPEIRFARSVIDYLVRWLGHRYLAPMDVDKALDEADDKPTENELGPPCPKCTGRTVKNNGEGYICDDCGEVVKE